MRKVMGNEVWDNDRWHDSEQDRFLNGKVCTAPLRSLCGVGAHYAYGVTPLPGKSYCRPRGETVHSLAKGLFIFRRVTTHVAGNVTQF